MRAACLVLVASKIAHVGALAPLQSLVESYDCCGERGKFVGTRRVPLVKFICEILGTVAAFRDRRLAQFVVETVLDRLDRLSMRVHVTTTQQRFKSLRVDGRRV